MTYAFTDTDGHHLDIQADTDLDGQPVITAWTRGTFARVPVRIPLDRIEELVAGIREAGRQAARGPNPQHVGGRANAENCPACWGTNPPYPFLCPGGTP
ncbi:hypothetical protein ACFW5V_28720 [Streptomyces sp. NPDC058762]|uniref:hypothetical protein n=1 Tax=Streptomyces sp. NPDC058762 TaxID=3346629 RepID=UPI0036B2D124